MMGLASKNPLSTKSHCISLVVALALSLMIVLSLSACEISPDQVKFVGDESANVKEAPVPLESDDEASNQGQAKRH